MTKMFIVSLAGLLLLGCAAQSSQKSNLTAGMVKKEIIKGVTTQTDILEVFGAPNIVTKNKSGNEVWTYDKVSVEKAASESYGTIIIAAIGGARSSTSTKTFTLMIEFGDSEVVQDYSYRSSAF
ncbi:hypothetical protein ACFL1E_05900 [Candidatus Omnitrophota bacterium]